MFGSLSSDVAQDRDGAVLANYLAVIGLFYLYSLTGAEIYLAVGLGGIFVASLFDALVNDISDEIDAPRIGEGTVTKEDMEEVQDKVLNHVGLALGLFVVIIVLSFGIFFYSIVGYSKNIGDSVASLLLVVQSLIFVKYVAKIVVVRSVNWEIDSNKETSQASLKEFD